MIWGYHYFWKHQFFHFHQFLPPNETCCISSCPGFLHSVHACIFCSNLSHFPLMPTPSKRIHDVSPIKINLHESIFTHKMAGMAGDFYHTSRKKPNLLQIKMNPSRRRNHQLEAPFLFVQVQPSFVFVFWGFIITILGEDVQNLPNTSLVLLGSSNLADSDAQALKTTNQTEDGPSLAPWGNKGIYPRVTSCTWSYWDERAYFY